MSYLVLARKYRPKQFSEMVGQDHVVRALGNALGSKRLHHAYLFTGTRGVGKTTVSRIMAKSLNCVAADGQGDITATPCGVCPACTAIDQGRFVDYTELDAASNRRVEEVQTLIDQAVYKPVQGRFKVFMIDEVHMLSTTAFNAMLKTLEEPPAYLKFILATTDPQKVPVTVLSRCLQFNLRPIPADTIAQHLQQVLDTEHIAYQNTALTILARFAHGSMRDALSLTDQAIAHGGGSIEEAGVRQMLGVVDSAFAFLLIEALAAGDGKSVVATVDALREQGLDAESTLIEISDLLQQMAVLQITGSQQQSAAIAENSPDGQRLRALAQALPADATQLLYSICLQGRQELPFAPDSYAGLVMVLLRLLAFQAPAHNVSSSAHLDPNGAANAESDAEKKKTLSSSPNNRGQNPIQTHPSPTNPIQTNSAQPTATKQPSVNLDAHNPANAETPTAIAPPLTPAAPAVVPLVALPVRELPQNSARVNAKIEPEPANAQHHWWLRTVAALDAASSITALTRELAIQSQCVERSSLHLTLRIENRTLDNESAILKLQQALNELHAQQQPQATALTLRTEIGPVLDSYAKRQQAALEQAIHAAEAEIKNAPLAQALMEKFGATMQPVTLLQSPRLALPE